MGQGVPLTDEDRVDLMLLPLMRQSAPLAALLPEIAAVVGALPEEQQAPTVGALAALELGPWTDFSKLGFSAALQRNATSSKFTAVPGAQPLQLW